jgi:hypothetical protein
MERGIAATIGTLIHRRASAAIYRYFYCTCRCGGYRLGSPRLSVSMLHW